jgi:uncharacterized protein (TIGR02284 family)
MPTHISPEGVHSVEDKMATQTSEATSVLNDLIETLKDGQEGFKQAAEKAKDPSLKSLFSKYASQRATYSQELQAVVSQLGEKPETSGHATGSLHRGWMGLKNALSGGDKALIDECEAGEDAAVKAYKEALQKPVPADVSTLIGKQYAGIQEAHGVIRDLKHSQKN